MSVIKIDDIKDQVEELVSRVQAGETILIEKDGKTVARLEGIGDLRAVALEPDASFDWNALKKFTDSQPLQSESAGEFMQRMRDEARY